MEHSEQINELAKALSLAQADLRNPAFDKVNPHFKSKFASLSTVRDTVTPTLSKHGLSVTQWPQTNEDGRIYVTTLLAHSSGQWISSDLSVPVGKADAHGTGASISYARRYALMAAVGVVGDDDDDGNHASGHAPKTPDETPPLPSLEDVKAKAEELAGNTDQLRAYARRIKAACANEAQWAERLALIQAVTA